MAWTPSWPPATTPARPIPCCSRLASAPLTCGCAGCWTKAHTTTAGWRLPTAVAATRSSSTPSLKATTPRAATTRCSASSSMTARSGASPTSWHGPTSAVTATTPAVARWRARPSVVVSATTALPPARATTPCWAVPATTPSAATTAPMRWTVARAMTRCMATPATTPTASAAATARTRCWKARTTPAPASSIPCNSRPVSRAPMWWCAGCLTTARRSTPRSACRWPTATTRSPSATFSTTTTPRIRTTHCSSSGLTTALSGI